LEPLLRLQERDWAIQYSLDLPRLLDCPVSGLPLRKRNATPAGNDIEDRPQTCLTISVQHFPA
jgi:hypothetical protein